MDRMTPRRVRLEPLLPKHYDFVYGMIADDDVAWRWRYRGAIPSRETMVAHMWDGVAVQKLVVAMDKNAMAGVVSLYNHNVRSGNAYIAAIAHPRYLRAGLVPEGAAALVDYGFAVLGLRKIYVEALEFNAGQFRTLNRVAVEEGRLRQHEYHDGRYWDMITWAIYRDRWSEFIANPLEAIRAEALQASV